MAARRGEGRSGRVGDPADAQGPARRVLAAGRVVQRDGRAARAVRDQGRHLVPGREQRAARVSVPQAAAGDDQDVARRVEARRSFPFYIVQLANFTPPPTEPGESDWAELREAQALTAKMTNNGLAFTIDIGDAGDIHPRNKEDVGKRLALVALGKAYGKADVVVRRAGVRVDGGRRGQGAGQVPQRGRLERRKTAAR